MGLSTNTTTYTGASNTFGINFALGYLDREHVTVRVNEEYIGPSPLYREYTWLDDNNIIVPNLEVGDTVTITRTTPKLALDVNFSLGENITKENLDRQAKQALMVYHELLDGRIEGLQSLPETLEEITARAEEAITAAQSVGSLVDIVVTLGGAYNAGDTVHALNRYWTILEDGTAPNTLSEDAFSASGWVDLTPEKLVVASGRLLTSNWFMYNSRLYAGSSGYVPSNSTDMFIGIDMHTGTLRVLPKNYSDGVVWLGKVSANSSSVTSLVLDKNPWARPCALPVTQAKLRSGEPLHVYAMGDSISSQLANAEGILWPDLLWGSYPAQGVRMTSDSGVSAVNTYVSVVAVPGSTAELGVAQLASYREPVKNIVFSGQSLSLGVEQTVLGNSRISASSIYDADLVTISYGMNGGKQRLLQLEKMIRMLRLNSTVEILITTSNFSQADYTRLEEECDLLRKLADVYGVALADTWSYVYQAHLNRLDGDVSYDIFPETDNIHPTWQGQREWAKAIRSCLPNFDLECRPQGGTVPDNWVAESLDTDFNKVTSTKFDGAEFQYVPSVQSAGVYREDTAEGNALNNAGVDSDSVYYNRRYKDVFPQWIMTGDLFEPLVIPAGEYVEFCHEATHGHRLVIDRDGDAEITVTINDNTAYVDDGDDGGTLPRVLNKNGESIDLSHGPAQQRIRITNTSTGSELISLMGVLFHTRGAKEVPFSDMNRVGDWEPSSLSSVDGDPDVDLYYKTDTVGDYVSIPFEGEGISVVWPRTARSGIYRVLLNGKQVDLLDELRTSNSVVFRAKNNYIANSKGSNVLTIILDAVTAGVEGSDLSYPRLGIIKASYW